jgi:hypothetical protein
MQQAMNALAKALTISIVMVSVLNAQERPLGAMRTKWAAEVSQETPWPEYPRRI